MFSLTTAAVVFGVVFLAELPDKTALAGLLLGTRFRASYVFAGVAAAFVVHVALAVAAGSVLTLLPQRPLQAVVGLLFLGGAVLVLWESRKRERGEEDGEDGEELRQPKQPSFWAVAGSGFMLILVAEFGDITQIMTANLAARYDDPLSVAVGAALALWAVAGIGILGGRALLRWVPLRVISRVAAAVMLGLAAFSLYEAVAG
ncbi:TMEM165/GDT1 family protein [Streptomyces sp. 7-21]|uniref:TMEM165/GDT1 family protein n=1 Tax=Streptomyces sp. 7-21 TaxID=2802283 RepID=UPI00192031C3|nr:TMEM165/GDT1 family protein [Streptomyces sp. 7-21]MBL1066531.1 TMEM165/GDT1 family protein [Streptomyces sp. 7-21]